MDLRTHLNSLPLLRCRDFPPCFKQVCLISFAASLHRIAEVMSARPATSLELVVMPDYERGRSPREYRYRKGDQECCVPVRGIGGLLNSPHLEKVYLFPPEDPFGIGLTGLCRALGPHGLRRFSLALTESWRFFGAQHEPGFHRDFAPVLEGLYQALADDDSRETYAARIKAVLTGEAGYLPVSSHEEYYHPLVQPERGDVMIDGGVSDMVEVQKRFAERVGPEGAVYGFEPIPWMFTAARDELAAWPQYHLQCMGLGRRQETVHFDDLRDSSRVSAENVSGPGRVACAMTTVDSFVRERGLAKVDCIKLDVEGAELDALKGARKTIQAHKPKLIVCLYHKVQDLVQIPAYIMNIAPEYEIRVAHSSVHFIDTVLYARVRPE